MTIQGSAVSTGPVEIRWASTTGLLLATATPTTTAAGTRFVQVVTIPNTDPGFHPIVAVSRRSDGAIAGQATTMFEVTAPPSPPRVVPPEPESPPRVLPPEPEPPAPPLTAFEPALDAPLAPAPDVFGPNLLEAALTAANGTRAVSPAGDLRLFCGRYDEAVTGTCGATAPPPARSAAAAAMRLRSRAFQARPGVSVYVRFRLTRSQRRALASATRMRLSGRVIARDAVGNQTQSGFQVVLRAPRRARAPRE